MERRKESNKRLPTSFQTVSPAVGTKATSPNSDSNVANISWAIHAARNSQRHWVQYSICTRGRLVIVHNPFVVSDLPSGAGQTSQLF